MAPNTSLNELTALMPNNTQDIIKFLLELTKQMYVLNNTVNELKSITIENGKSNKKSGDVSRIKEVVSLTILSFYFSISY